MSSTIPTSQPTPYPTSQPGQPAWDIALLYPVQGSWTEADYLELKTNRLVEFTDGCIEVLAMPTIYHQMIVMFLHGLLKDFVERNATGTVFFAPLAVRLGPEKFREPDIVFARPERIQDRHGQPDGADLVVEVVSEGQENRRRDLEVKRAEYAKAGIAEYWIVDPEHRHITVLRLDGTEYQEHGVFARDDKASSVLLSGFTVMVNDVFAAGEASPE